jgi:hypothetical protein
MARLECVCVWLTHPFVSFGDLSSFKSHTCHPCCWWLCKISYDLLFLWKNHILLPPFLTPSTLCTTNFSHDSYFFISKFVFSIIIALPFFHGLWCVMLVQHMQACISEYKIKKRVTWVWAFSITPGFVSPPARFFG